MQEFGETIDAILQDDQKKIDRILDKNKARTDLYWIIIAAKPGKLLGPNGEFTLMRHFKAHSTKPMPMVGVIVIEVDNKKGTVKWDINLPDVPFDYKALGGEEGATQIESSIPEAYIYN